MPRLSNFDDFSKFPREPRVRYICPDRLIVISNICLVAVFSASVVWSECRWRQIARSERQHWYGQGHGELGRTAQASGRQRVRGDQAKGLHIVGHRPEHRESRVRYIAKLQPSSRRIYHGYRESITRVSYISST